MFENTHKKFNVCTNTCRKHINIHEESRNLTHQEKILIQHLNALEHALTILDKNLQW
jgi:hypothetical protein